jgi:hypothetical protein
LNSKKDDEFTREDLEKISQYEGQGGQGGEAATGDSDAAGVLHEYFTPKEIVNLMWRLCLKHGFKGGRVLEPSAGTGRFLTYAPAQTEKPIFFDAIDINPLNARIIKLLHPQAHVSQQGFEELFINMKKNESVKEKIKQPEYDLVIGNPPYGSPESYYMGLGESEYAGTNWIGYFINRGLDVVKEGGLLCFIIGSSIGEGFLGGKKDEKSANYAIKKAIAGKGLFLEAFKIPQGAFSPQAPSVQADIILFRKEKYQ